MVQLEVFKISKKSICHGTEKHPGECINFDKKCSVKTMKSCGTHRDKKNKINHVYVESCSHFNKELESDE